jgi:hypothetical protein
MPRFHRCIRAVSSPKCARSCSGRALIRVGDGQMLHRGIPRLNEAVDILFINHIRQFLLRVGVTKDAEGDDITVIGIAGSGQ